MAGVPVMAEGGHGGGVRLDESYRAGLTGLGEGKLRALLVSTDGALAADLGMGEAFRLGRLKLQAARAKRFEPSLEILQRRVFIDSRWGGGTTKAPIPSWHPCKRQSSVTKSSRPGQVRVGAGFRGRALLVRVSLGHLSGPLKMISVSARARYRQTRRWRPWPPSPGVL